MMLPDLTELIGLRNIAERLTLGEHRSALANVQGHHRSALRGRGLEFEEVRPYVQGDDARHIDWRVTARRGRLHTRLFREERERPVWIVADLHAGLFFGSRYQLKSALLIRAAALLGWISSLEGDRVGAILPVSGGIPEILPPRRREAGLLPILERLIQRQPRTPALPDLTSLSSSISTLLTVLQPGSLVCLLSDFSGLNKNAEQALLQLSLHADCRFIQIIDPLEEEGLQEGLYPLGLPGKTGWLDGKTSRNAWKALWSDRMKHLEQLLSSTRIPLITLKTIDPIESVLPFLLKKVTR